MYDPAAGRFTQEDPIGLAGGLNLYGFANGDPVNFSDPFGLYACDPPASCRAQLIAFGTTLGTGAGVLVAGGCIAGSGGICVLGAPGIVGGLAAAGAASGAVAGQVAEQADAIALEMGKIGNKIRSIVTGILIGRGGGLSDEQELIRKGGAKPATEQVEEERRRKELEKKRGEGAPGPKDPLDQP